MEELSTKLERLRMRAQAALERPDARDEAIALLDAIVAEAPRGSEEALSAHRQRAELRIENHPWRAALHLRALREGGADDDSVHGLLGLCHALLGNFVAAAAAYRRALELSPRNPWYHHNLGHVLDAALGQSELALSHLTIAHGMEPEELEISASLAHCLARLGR
ncbi:MAG: tetratricopeptide repeat protein, partial [Myxococcales bacterium]|nr:tetratricopeptide repeat protein [Myxococcales bacterium]